MAADQTAAQKAADEKAAAEAKAAEEQKAAEEKARQEAEAGKAGPKTRAATTSKGHRVIGAAVVLRTKDKAERYLYRGAVVPDGVFADDSIKHALSVGLIEKVK